MDEDDKDSVGLSKLKRHIIATDKLVTKVTKLEAKYKKTETCINEKDEEIVKLKRELLSLKSKPVGNEASLENGKEIENLKKQFHEREETLRKEAKNESLKAAGLEKMLGKLKEKVGILEKEIKSKNDNIIQREIESQALKSQLEDLQRSNKTLENNLANDTELQKTKMKFEEIQWSHLAEINRLKQESASTNNTVEQLKKSNENLLRSKTDLNARLESFNKQEKESVKLNKVLEKKEKHISNIEKKLEQSRKEIENLKIKLKNKGIVALNENFVEDNVSSDTEEDSALNDESPVETCPTPRPMFSLFRFSQPTARFAIGRPRVPDVGSRKTGFTKKATCVENMPVPFNLKPVISDYYPILSTVNALKRKSVENKEDKAPKRMKQDIPSSSETPSKKTDEHGERSVPLKKIRTEIPATPEASRESAHPKTPPADTKKLSSSDELSMEPNPVKTRKARSTVTTSRPGISPITKLRQKMSKKHTQIFQPEVTKVLSSPFKLPPQLSPIKSPQVSKPEEPLKTLDTSKALASSSITALNGAKAKIFASGLGPRAVEAPTKSVGGRLNQTQLEAAKRRSVPTSSVSLMPSVDGFRQSGREQKPANIKTEKRQMKVSDNDIYCPSRKKTNPAKLSLSVLPHEDPVQQDKDTSISSRQKAFKSKEFVSTESDSSDTEKVMEKSKLSETLQQAEPKDYDKEEEQETIQRSDRVLDDDLNVSDSGEDSDTGNVDHREMLKDECHEENEERFSKMRSERVPAKPESYTVGPGSEEKSQRGPKFITKIEELVHNFKVKADRNFQLLKAEREKLTQQRSELMYEATVDLLKKLFGHLLGSQNEESFRKIIKSLTCSEVMICDMVCEYLKMEHKDTPLLSEVTSDQPAITRKQQRLFTLLVTLSQQNRYKSIIETMTNLLWHNIFGFDRMYNHRLNAIQNYGRMFVLCARYSDNADLVKHFVYDLFYFKSPRNHLLVGIVVALWPDIFPRANTKLAETPLVETIVWCVFNTGPDTYSVEMKVEETKENFERETAFRANAFKADSLVKKFLEMAKETTEDEKTLNEITKSLLLIGRCKGYLWVNNNIFMRLLKIVGEEKNQTFLSWVFSTLGIVSRVYPVEGRENIKQIFESVLKMLSSRDIPVQLERSCVWALFHLGYHLQLQVALFLKTWQPVHPLEAETQTLMEDFIGTRGKTYAFNTVQAVTRDRNKLRKKGIVSAKT